jgi:hypothetical protein
VTCAATMLPSSRPFPSHAANTSSVASAQGLTLVDFSAQPEPFLTLNTSPKRLNITSDPALNTP